MTGPQLVAGLTALVIGLLLLGWMLLRGFVSDLKETRDVVAKGQECWDEASTLATKVDRAVDLLEPRVTRLEGHDYQKLNDTVIDALGRLGRMEIDIQALDRRLDALQTTSVETNAIVKELRSRRRTDRQDS